MSLRIKVTKIPKLNTLVIRQEGRYFLASKDSIVIDIPGLVYLIKFLIFNGFLSYRALEGILEEYHSFSSIEHRKE